MKKILSTSTLIAALTLSACGFNDPDTSDSETGGSTNDYEQLTIANPADITTFDPHNNSVITTSAVLVNVYSKLVQRDETGDIVPDLAVKWEEIDDTTVEFQLRDDVTFHNGDPFTASDVKFSLERVAGDSSLQQHSTFSQIESVEVVDEHTVRITTNEPDPQLISRLSTPAASILPQDHFEEVGAESFFQSPIGTGPFQYESWQQDEAVNLVKYDNYFEGAPNWENVRFSVVPEDSTRVSELLTEGIDIAFNIPTADMERIDNNDGTHVALEPIQRVIQLWMSNEDGTTTSDPAVREAIDLAIDNQVIIDEILNGSATATRTHITPGNFGADESLYDTYEYNPEQAKEILADAGYEDGVSVDLSVNNYYTEMAEVVGGMLADVGITANIELIEQSRFANQLFSGELAESIFVGWGNDMFDASVLEFFLEDGVAPYTNPEIDALLEDAAYNMDEEEREAQYQEVQQILAEERGAVYLFQLQGRYGVNDRLDYTPRLDELYYVNDITLSED
ncbi:ABC transporter substrate-binding protein [Shouchella patagoniensis]|uniref:ABC transporter substrate-binding protein n=1 Tax=Shouchella patagoniensis TaxID=228576 RepID=UPI0009958215|nr:ABC transporter substrate-binding protein [Shouchella patagoniensis]